MITPDQIHLVLEYLWINGQLTAPSIIGSYTLTNATGKDEMDEWRFPEPALTVKQLEEIEASQEYQDYLLNRDNILAEKELAKALENPALKLVAKQLNELTKLLQTSKDIAEINVEAGKLDPLPEKDVTIEVSAISKK